MAASSKLRSRAPGAAGFTTPAEWRRQGQRNVTVLLSNSLSRLLSMRFALRDQMMPESCTQAAKAKAAQLESRQRKPMTDHD